MATKRAYMPIKKVDYEQRRKAIFEMLERANMPPRPTEEANHA
ncbi:hypothetical protein [Aliivibrio fischeri]|nr:hypothetical protein [Aliivibrio fischeri]